ncbi:Rootletin [Nymphon striatum]|nr:Rootletin [Nymphon striatum]
MFHSLFECLNSSLYMQFNKHKKLDRILGIKENNPPLISKQWIVNGSSNVTEKSKTELLKESYELRDTLRDVETSRLKLKKEMCRIKDRFDIAQAEMKNLNNELSQVLSLRKQDHIREESTQKEIVELKQKLIEKEAFCEASQKEIKNLDQKLISNQTDCKIKFQSLEYALDESQKSEHRVDSDRRYLENQLQSVTEEVATLKMHLNSAEGEINGLKNYLSPLEVSKQKLEVELTEFRSAVRSTLGSTLQKTINLSDLQEISPNILHLSLQDLVQQLRSTETQKEKSIIQVKELQKQLHELDQEKNKSLIQLSVVKQSMNTIQQDKDKMSYKLQAAKSALVSLEQVIKSLKSEKSVLYKKITEMESKTSSVNTLNHHQERLVKSASELAKRVDIKDAIGWLKLVWTSVSEETIQKCFEKCISNQKLALSKAEALITELQMMKVSLEEEVMYYKGSVNDRITENEVFTFDRYISLQVSVDRLNLALNKSSEGQSQLKHQVYIFVINLNRSLSEKSSSTTHLNVRIRELQSSLKSSEEDRLLIQSRLDNSKKKIINDQHENEQNQLSKIRNLLAEKKILQEKCLETQNELQHTEWDKKLAQKSQSKLVKDKNILKKTLHKVEQEKLATEKVPLSDELEKLELKHENQNLKAKIMENEQMQVQEISNITMRYRQEIDLSNERIKKFHSNSEKLFETREEAHRQKILRLEGEIRILRQQMQEDAHKRRTYIMKSLEAGKEAKELRKTLHSSLNNISTLDSSQLTKALITYFKGYPTPNHAQHHQWLLAIYSPLLHSCREIAVELYSCREMAEESKDKETWKVNAIVAWFSL